MPPKTFHIGILAGGQEEDVDYCRSRLEQCDRTLCANGGLKLARRVGWLPSAVVGDLDSLDDDHREYLARKRVPHLEKPADKDESDLEIALQVARSWGGTSVEILGGFGGRLDHMLFNLVGALSLAHTFGLQARMTGSRQEAFLVHGQGEVQDRQGWTASLLCLTEKVDGVFLHGFRYRLGGETLYRHHSRSLSNRVEAKEAFIRVKEGLLLALLLAPEKK